MQCESQNVVQVMPADQTGSLLEVGGPSSGDYAPVWVDYDMVVSCFLTV